MWHGLIMIFMDLFYASLQFLPYGLVVKAIDPLINNDIEKLLKTGGPPFIQKCPIGVMLWHPFVKNRGIIAHWSLGLGHWSREKEDFYGLFEEVKAKVPASRLLSFDFKKQGWEDLC